MLRLHAHLEKTNTTWDAWLRGLDYIREEVLTKDEYAKLTTRLDKFILTGEIN